MTHEQSETVQTADGLWINVYGRNTPRAGQQLPGTPAYPTMQEAVAAAQQRSDEYRAPLPGMLDRARSKWDELFRRDGMIQPNSSQRRAPPIIGVRG